MASESQLGLERAAGGLLNPFIGGLFVWWLWNPCISEPFSLPPLDSYWICVGLYFLIKLILPIPESTDIFLEKK